jgi:metal-responsive CopG/Arc/MetJ family transcriptional regulator
MTEAEIREVGARLKPGAKKKKARLKQTPVMLDIAERQALDKVADELGRSRSALIREAVRKVWLKGR